jgi:hypothetical protein
MRRWALLAAVGGLVAVALGGCFKGKQTIRPDSVQGFAECEIHGICNVGCSGGAPGSSHPAPSPKEGVTVVAWDDKAQRTVDQTTTDDSGRFSLRVRTGTYRVLAYDDRLGACSPAERTVRAEPGRPVEIAPNVYVITP